MKVPFIGRAGEPVDTGKPHRCRDLLYRWLGLPCEYIYVVDLHDRLFLGRKVKGRFHHSSFLGARPVRAAGGMVVRRGRLLVITASSGHYKPTAHMLDGTLKMFGEKYGLGLDAGYVRIYPSTSRCCCGRVHVPAECENFPCCCCLRRRSKKIHPREL